MRRVLLLLVMACTIWVGAGTAHADSDVVRDWNATYEIQADGSVNARVELDWDFGETGRRGIIHDLVIREPWQDDRTKDVVYEVTNIDVDSPTGAPDSFTQDEVRDGQFRLLSLQIGDPDVTLDKPRHTYVITYTLTGAMRTFGGEPEFFWDINSGDDVPIDNLDVTVSGPEAAIEARCLAGPNECQASEEDGKAVLKATDVSGQIVSAVAAFPPGSVDNAQPVLVDAPTASDVVDWDAAPSGGVIAAFVAAVAALHVALGRLTRARPKHERWSAVAPGVMDPGGPVETTRKPFEGAAVRFEPPDATLTEAGLALDLEYQSSHLSANIVAMAVNGSAEVVSEPLSVVRGDRSRIRTATEGELFQIATDRSSPAPLTDDQTVSMTQAVRRSTPTGENAITKRTTKHRRSLLPFLFIAIILIIIATAVLMGDTNVVQDWLHSTLTPIARYVPWILLVIVGGFVGLVIGSIFSSSSSTATSLTPRGSAIRAQAEGFRQYIATAEAGQLNFEADQDIYRRYLPWAVLFDLTDRWTDIGEELVRMGRLPASSVQVVHGTSSLRSTRDSIEELNRRARLARQRQIRDERAAEHRRASASRSYGRGSGGRSGRSSGSRGGGGGSRSKSW